MCDREYSRRVALGASPMVPVGKVVATGPQCWRAATYPPRRLARAVEYRRPDAARADLLFYRCADHRDRHRPRIDVGDVGEQLAPERLDVGRLGVQDREPLDG